MTEDSGNGDIEDARRGDREALGRIVERLTAPLTALAYERTRNAADAMDAVQDAFLTAFERLHQLREPDKFLPWISQIVRNECAMKFRHADRERRAAAEKAEQDAPDAAARSLDTLTETERHAALRRAVDRLSPPLREAVYLRYLSDVPRQEAADMLDIAPDTLDKRLQRALEELRQQLRGL